MPDFNKAAPEVTETTRAFHKQVRDYLPFDDRTDFEDASRGLVARWPADQVPALDGRVSWDIAARDYIEADCPETVNPSLWRQAQLNNIHGLFKVCDRLWQVRGYDLANISFVEGDTGWIVIDTGMTADFAAAALKLANDELGERPVTGVIYTHSHVDHYGGSRGILTEEEAAERNVPIIAPDGFLHEAVSENVIAGAPCAGGRLTCTGFSLAMARKLMSMSVSGQAIRLAPSVLLRPTISSRRPARSASSMACAFSSNIRLMPKRRRK